MTGQQLKNSILQLAIQGKLVPQIESEGTAEDLLKDIRAEKDKLVKEGKLKKNVLVACITRNGKIIFPRGKDTIASGDTVIVVTTHKGLKDISDILE